MDQVIFGGYGLLLLTGAYFGGRAGSRVSVIMGIVSGVLVLAATAALGMNPKCSLLFLSAVAGILTAIFLMRLLKTHKLMPSGILFLVSLAVLGYSLRRLYST